MHICNRFLLLIFACFVIVSSLSSVALPLQSDDVIDDHSDHKVSSSPTVLSLKDTQGDNEWTSHRLPHVWISDLFYETLANFTVSKDIGSSACQRQTQMYTRHLKNGSMWAIQSKFVYTYLYNCIPLLFVV